MAKVSEEELAAAFTGKPAKKTRRGEAVRRAGGEKKQKIIALAAVLAGVLLLAGGIFMLISKSRETSRAADGEFLVAAGEWTLNCEDDEACESVVWDFTEIGKGKLTTNAHKNDYDFIWAIRDGKLLVETDWLYDLENEYDYTLDQEARVLTLKDGEKTYTFTASNSQPE